MPNNEKSPHRVSPFSREVIFTRAPRFARSTIPEEKWGLLIVYQRVESLSCHAFIHLKPEKGTPFERASPYRPS